MSNKFGVVLVVGALVASATACSGSGSPNPTSSTTKGTASTSSELPASAAKVPTSVANDPKIRKQVVLNQKDCTAMPGGWQAGGTATNSGTGPTTFSITVFFTTTHATVLSYAQTKVRVDAGKSQKWSLESKFAAPKSVLCVLRGVATTS